MVGLDAAGKTTILYKLKLGEIVTTIPTIGKGKAQWRLMPTTEPHSRLTLNLKSLATRGQVPTGLWGSGKSGYLASRCWACHLHTYPGAL